MKQGFPESKGYKVLVQCCTYNQSKYIEDTLKGFAMQQTNFPFVCVVMDDASTDGEQEVLKRWIENHCNAEDIETYDNDDAIILMAKDKSNANCMYAIYLLKKNLYEQPRKQELFKMWREHCEYETLCEGDDYWIHPKKLQLQTTFLDSHPDYGLVYTQCKRFIQEEQAFSDKIGGGTSEEFIDILSDNPIPTLTTMYRADLWQKYAEEINPLSKNWKMGDYPFWVWISANSKVKAMPIQSAVYRILQNSASHGDYEHMISFVKSIYDIRSFYCEYYGIELLSFYDSLYSRLFDIAFYHKKTKDALLYYKRIPVPTIKQQIKHMIAVVKCAFGL